MDQKCVGTLVFPLLMLPKGVFAIKSSAVYKHLHDLENVVCKDACNTDCFSILDRAPTKYQLLIRQNSSSGSLFSLTEPKNKNSGKEANSPNFAFNYP